VEIGAAAAGIATGWMFGQATQHLRGVRKFATALNPLTRSSTYNKSNTCIRDDRALLLHVFGPGQTGYEGMRMGTVISDAVVVTAMKEQFSCPLGDETIILNMKAGLYFSLDNVGAFIWQLVREPRSVKELREAIIAAYDVEPEVCERDLVALLHELADKNLVEIRNPVAT
jgi:hypothetical protein